MSRMVNSTKAKRLKRNLYLESDDSVVSSKCQPKKFRKADKENQSRRASLEEHTFHKLLFEQLIESRETEPERRYDQLERDCQERCRVADEKIELFRKKLLSVNEENVHLRQQLNNIDGHGKKMNESKLENAEIEKLRNTIDYQQMTIRAYQKFVGLHIEPLPIRSVNTDKEFFNVHSQDLKGFSFKVRYNKSSKEYMYTPCIDPSLLDPSQLPRHLQEEIYFDDCPMFTARALISSHTLLKQGKLKAE